MASLPKIGLGSLPCLQTIKTLVYQFLPFFLPIYSKSIQNMTFLLHAIFQSIFNPSDHILSVNIILLVETPKKNTC